jgi:hypothetical protein
VNSKTSATGRDLDPTGYTVKPEGVEGPVFWPPYKHSMGSAPDNGIISITVDPKTTGATGFIGEPSPPPPRNRAERRKQDKAARKNTKRSSPPWR